MKNRLLAILILTTALLMSVAAWISLKTGHDKKKKEGGHSEVEDSEFRKAAELHGTPVTSIRLAEHKNINDRFLVTIANRYNDVQELSLDYVQITDDGLRELLPLEKLKSLSLFGVSKDGFLISDRGLENIRSIKTIETLSLGMTAISDKGLESLRELPRLRELAISSSPITDQGMVVIGGFPSLEKLILIRTEVTDKGLAADKQDEKPAITKD